MYTLSTVTALSLLGVCRGLRKTQHQTECRCRPGQARSLAPSLKRQPKLSKVPRMFKTHKSFACMLYKFSGERPGPPRRPGLSQIFHSTSPIQKKVWSTPGTFIKWGNLLDDVDDVKTEFHAALGVVRSRVRQTTDTEIAVSQQLYPQTVILLIQINTTIHCHITHATLLLT